MRSRVAPDLPWTVVELERDPFEVLEAVRARMHPGEVPLEKDRAFDHVMERRKLVAEKEAATARRGRHGVADSRKVESAAREVLEPSQRPVAVRDTSMMAYRALEWRGALSRQHRLLTDFLVANKHRDYTRQELAQAMQWGVNVICGRVKELIEDPFLFLEEGARRECRVTGEQARPLKLRHVERQHSLLEAA